jgi:hypothetical protein
MRCAAREQVSVRKVTSRSSNDLPEQNEHHRKVTLYPEGPRPRPQKAMRFDGALIDYRLPIISDPDLALKLKSVHPDVPKARDIVKLCLSLG